MVRGIDRRMENTMTDEIFRHDGYTFEFEANVVSAEGDQVILDSTAFYPGGGGQVCDTGFIRGNPVVEAYYNKDGDIVHKVPEHDLKPGERVWCSVDWDRRYDLMQGHTGEHLLFCALRRQCEDLEITKIYISPESKYVIVNHDLEWSQIKEAMRFANQAIKDNHMVTKSVMDRDDPDLENVRIKLDRIEEGEEITVVAIGDIDLSACSGVHVMETAELEMIMVDRKVSSGKDGIAIHFKVGDSAKNTAADLSALALEIVENIGCKIEDAPKAVSNMKHQVDLDSRMLKSAVKSIVSGLVAEDVNGSPVYSAILPAADRSVISEAAENIKSKGGVAAFVVASDTLSVLLASGNGSLDCKKVLNDVLSSFGGRGGGKPDFAQGGIPDASKANDVVDALMESIRGSIS